MQIKKKLKRFSIYLGMASLLYCLKDSDQLNVLKNSISIVRTDPTSSKHSPSFEDVRNAVDCNKDLSDNDKKRVLDNIDVLQEKIPYIDLDCLYKNCNDLKITHNDEPKEHVYGTFNKYNSTINLEVDTKIIFNHEFLHMLDHVYTNDGNTSLEIKHSWDTSKGKLLKEGFTEWLNSYLFDTKPSAYETQVADIEIMKYIFNNKDKDLIDLFVNKSYKDFVNRLNDYLSNEEISELLGLCVKEKEDTDNYNISDITKKYSIMLKLCINSRGNNLNKNDLYVIQNLFYNSYQKCPHLKSDYENIAQLKKYIFNETIKCLEDVNNEIVLYNYDDEVINYCDFNNMYLIYDKNSTGLFSYTLGEKYIDNNNKVNYYIDDDFLTYDEKLDNEIVPLKSLFDKEEIKNISDKGIHLEDVVQKYNKMYGVETNNKQYKKSMQKMY